MSVCASLFIYLFKLFISLFNFLVHFRVIAIDHQDATPCEIRLALLAVNDESQRLCLAGDTAQAIQQGSAFRFGDPPV